MAVFGVLCLTWLLFMAFCVAFFSVISVQFDKKWANPFLSLALHKVQTELLAICAVILFSSCISSLCAFFSLVLLEQSR